MADTPAKQGRRACEACVAARVNPHAPGSHDAVEWAEGYEAERLAAMTVRERIGEVLVVGGLVVLVALAAAFVISLLSISAAPAPAAC